MNIQQLHEQSEQTIDQAVSSFRKQVDKIESSENPRFKDPEVKQYEINQAREQLENEVQQVTESFNAQIDEAISEAETKAARSSLRTSDYDMKTAQGVLDDYVTDALLAYNENDKRDAAQQLEQRLEHFSEGELAAVKKALPGAIQQMNGDSQALKALKSINNTLSNLQTLEQQELDELRQLKINQPDNSFRRLEIIHPAFKDLSKNRFKN